MSQQPQLQQQIIEIWKEILKKEDVQPDDDFIELGGQSLHAVRIAFKCQKLLNKRVTTAMIIRSKNVRTLAETLEG